MNIFSDPTIKQKERILTYLKAKGVSQYAFLSQLGVSKAYLRNMRKGFGADKLPLIRKICPDLNVDWLVTGHGNMLNESNLIEQPPLSTTARPIIPDSVANSRTSAIDWLQSSKRHVGVQYVDIGDIFPDCSYIYNVTQDAMLPDFKIGDKLLIERLGADDNIINGRPYVIHTSSGLLFRLLYDKGANIECRVTNPDSNLENMVIAKNSILSIYLVVGMYRIGA